MRQFRERLGRLLFGAVTYAARRRARAVQRLASAAGAGRPVTTLVDTGTRVDTGAWGWRGRLSVCLLADELLLLAPGRRAYVERAGRPELDASLYNAVTGELVLAPANGLRQRTVRVSPVDGYAILRWALDGETEREVKHA